MVELLLVLFLVGLKLFNMICLAGGLFGNRMAKGG